MEWDKHVSDAVATVIDSLVMQDLPVGSAVLAALERSASSSFEARCPRCSLAKTDLTIVGAYRFPSYPRQRTSAGEIGMSAKGQ
jgi:hypothetical protein